MELCLLARLNSARVFQTCSLICLLKNEYEEKHHIPLLNVVEYLLFSKCPGNLSDHELSEKLGDYKRLKWFKRIVLYASQILIQHKPACCMILSLSLLLRKYPSGCRLTTALCLNQHSLTSSRSAMAADCFPHQCCQVHTALFFWFLLRHGFIYGLR